ncbi:retinitis pigmentosa 9 protein [Petaurus breviceps papuanus]|uniref:retinitis pigmentosa 9 protein n=1 Tax=Petaurus breviceps papuanus TaxID=3040969 RepID=UPI0036DE237D
MPPPPKRAREPAELEQQRRQEQKRRRRDAQQRQQLQHLESLAVAITCWLLVTQTAFQHFLEVFIISSYEKPPPGLIKEDETKPEDCIPDVPGNEHAREFLAHAPTKGLWMPLGKEVKVMQCWRCKRYGHRTGDKECPFFIKGNQKLEQFRVVSTKFYPDLFSKYSILVALCRKTCLREGYLSAGYMRFRTVHTSLLMSYKMFPPGQSSRIL